MDSSADKTFSSRSYKEHAFLSVQILLWFLLAQSDSFPEWFDYLCLAVVVAFLLRMHFLVRQLQSQTPG